MTRNGWRDDTRPGWSHWSQVGRQYRVLCSDGVVRTATATADADTFFSIPARVSVRGRTVSGSVSHRGDIDYQTAGWPAYAADDPTPLYRFTAYTYGRNGGMLPSWPDHAPYAAPEPVR